MSQRNIDLLPESIRRQCEMGARTGRLITSVVAAVLIIVVFATQSRWQLDRERQRLDVASEQAEAVHAAERQAHLLEKELAEITRYIAMYERLALPLDISSVLATLVNELPTSVTLEAIDLEAGERRAARMIRGAASDDARPPRLLVGEMSGFALTDDEIARLVMRLQNREGFEEVTLDFSRTRAVRDTIAREFRISFRLDLDHQYEVIKATASANAIGDYAQ